MGMPVEGIDDLDEHILKYLENDARKSLKKLAEELNKKTSTIYHRLQRMQNNKTILGYSVVFNPEIFDIAKIGMVRIELKPHNIKGFDNMFIQSFAKFLKEEYPEILFISILESEPNNKEVFCIIPFKSEQDYEDFSKTIKENPYVENITFRVFSEIIKGQKLFNFDKDMFKKSTHKEEIEDMDTFIHTTEDITDLNEEKEIKIDMSEVLTHPRIPRKK